MQGGTGTVRTVGELEGPRFGKRDERFDRLDGQRRMHHQQLWNPRDKTDPDEVFHGIITRIRDHARGGGERIGHRQKGIAIGRCTGHDAKTDESTCPGTVIHDHLLAQALAHPLRDHADDDVEIAACRERHDDAHRLGGVWLSEGDDRTAHAHQRQNRLTYAAHSTRRRYRGRPFSHDCLRVTTWMATPSSRSAHKFERLHHAGAPRPASFLSALR